MILTIIKVSVAKDAAHAPADWSQFVAGQPSPNGKSLPIDYEIQGELIQPILPGHRLAALRFMRNGVPALGVFESSEIREIHVFTANSVYRISAAR